MITGDQLLCHAIGDYILQSDWMATEKTKRHLAAFIHALTYSLPFLIFHPSLVAWLVIFGTHELIDRYRLARYIVWAKNFIAPVSVRGFFAGEDFTCNLSWGECSGTGYPPDRPAWLAVWLLIIADNILHVAINAAALRWL